MKKIIIIISALLIAVSGLSAQESDVVYIEGWVDIKDNSGATYELLIGDRVYFGDTVITGWDGVAELEPENGSIIIVKPDTVFSIKETDLNGKKQSVIFTTLGQVSFKFHKMTQEPLISTPSTVMGVRGTEFTVYAGADGSSLVTVESGAVEVSGQGEAVILEEAEGVEIPTGMPPGEKFEVKGKAVDFAEWNKGKIDAMMDKPLEALSNITAQLGEMAEQADKWAKLHEDSQGDIEKLRAEMDALFEENKDDEANLLYKERLRPLEITALKYVMNYRYYALSALSMRQHILSGFYIRMKSAYISDLENAVYMDFMDEYQSTLAGFEKQVAPRLVEADY